MKPILFNTEMVRAILEGRKTVTRRCIKFLKGKNPSWTGYVKDNLMLYNGNNEPCCQKPPYQVGDVLYVRETWNVDRVHTEENKIGVMYKADGSFAWVDVSEEKYDKYDRSIAESNFDSWKPSIHMPKEAARIFLKVTDVRVERLNDITEDQACDEGINVPIVQDMTGEMVFDHSPIDDFAILWDSTIKKENLHLYSWDENPYVWVIEFERCEKPERED